MQCDHKGNVWSYPFFGSLFWVDEILSSVLTNEEVRCHVLASKEINQVNPIQTSFTAIGPIHIHLIESWFITKTTSHTHYSVWTLPLANHAGHCQKSLNWRKLKSSEQCPICFSFIIISFTGRRSVGTSIVTPTNIMLVLCEYQSVYRNNSL